MPRNSTSEPVLAGKFYLRITGFLRPRGQFLGLCFGLLAGHAAAESTDLFNGRDLEGWSGLPEFWSVENGTITGESTPTHPAPHNTFLVWNGEPVKNFRLTCQVRVEGNNNSGIQFRSRLLDREGWIVGGYQCDIHPGPWQNGMVYEERGRGILARNGEKVLIHPDGTLERVESLAPTRADISQWTEFSIEARGNLIIQKVNGQISSMLIDRQKEKRAMEGILALQLHAGPPAKVQFKNIKLERLPDDEADVDSFGRATPVEELDVMDGFRAELIYTVPRSAQGSWVSMTKDPRGGLTVSDQYGKLYHVVPPALDDPGSPAVVREMGVELGHAQGLLWAFNSLYAMVNGSGIAGHGSGLYRLRDTNGDRHLDEIRCLKKIPGGGEHGPHAVILGPDKKSLFVVSGNHTKLPEGITSSRIPQNWGEDLLLPRQPDARGHAATIRAPGGWICKTDPEGKTWEVFSIGFRNTYDIAFNPEGELFTYDADMEWDLGTPWYRPTRICHVVSGSEFGWRTGTGKWPVYYPDSLPPVLNVGPGSPTGIIFGTEAEFPPRYRRALFALDWTFGTIYAVHLLPNGASYSGEIEEFLSGTALPLTDVTVGTDGAMYFTVGGRRTQSALYRIRYVGSRDTSPPPLNPGGERPAVAIRHRLESFHGHRAPEAVEAAWRYLGDSDRFLRYAARIAVESQEVSLWQERALQEPDPHARINALVALARQGDATLRPRVLNALEKISYENLTATQKLELLRAYALAFVRLGMPPVETRDQIARYLDQYYPAGDYRLNRELSRLLVGLQFPGVIPKTLDLMAQEKEPPVSFNTELLERNPGYGRTILKMLTHQPQRQQIHYALVLRNLRYGWTLEQRQEFFAWFRKARQNHGGASYQGFLDNIESDALENTSPAERAALAELTGESVEPPPADTVTYDPPKGPGREWTLGELMDPLPEAMHDRDFENGKAMFHTALCSACHRFDGAGGSIGPDLTSVGNRFGYRDLIETLLYPNRVISDQYAASILTTTNGSKIGGRILDEKDGKYEVMTNPLDPAFREFVPKKEVVSIAPSPVSPMPAGLLYGMNRDEVYDLVAYLVSAGNPNHKVFAPRTTEVAKHRPPAKSAPNSP